MADGTPGQPKGKMAMGTGLLVSACLAFVGWGLLAQSWAKDAGHEVLLERIDQARVVSTLNSEKNDRQDATLAVVMQNQERILANQENFVKMLERIERKLP